MAGHELTLAPTDAPAAQAPAATAAEHYGRPLAIVTTLFFMWGFLTCLNDILVPHLKSIFELSYAQGDAGPVRVLLGVLPRSRCPGRGS